MNTVVKCILSGIGGALVGAGVSFFITKKVNNKHWKEECMRLQNEALNEQKEALKKKYCESESIPSEPVEEPIKENIPEETKISEKTDVPLVDDIEMAHTDYHSIVKTHYDIPEEFEESDAYLQKKLPSKDKPYLISRAAFDGDIPEMERDYYMQIDVTYYTKDYITNDDDTRTPCPVCYSFENGNPHVMTEFEVMRSLGYEWRWAFYNEDDPTYQEKYGMFHYDDDCVYVRNDAEQVQYCITRLKAFYKVEILGLDPDDDHTYDEVVE